jgi:thiol:disulfide interchange protein
MNTGTFLLMKIILGVVFLLAGCALFLIVRKSRRSGRRTPLQWIGIALSVGALGVALGGAYFVQKLERAFLVPLEQIGKNFSALRVNQVADDAALSLDQYKGKVVLLNYWATW